MSSVVVLLDKKHRSLPQRANNHYDYSFVFLETIHSLSLLFFLSSHVDKAQTPYLTCKELTIIQVKIN